MLYWLWRLLRCLFLYLFNNWLMFFSCSLTRNFRPSNTQFLQILFWILSLKYNISLFLFIWIVRFYCNQLPLTSLSLRGLVVALQILVSLWAFSDKTMRFLKLKKTMWLYWLLNRWIWIISAMVRKVLLRKTLKVLKFISLRHFYFI